MNTTSQPGASKITATQVDRSERGKSLTRVFRHYASSFEDATYRAMGRLSPDYETCYWQFFALSNDGFYMAPQWARLQIKLPCDGYDEHVTGDAAGVIVCILALMWLVERYRSDVMMDRLHQLVAFASQHAERDSILRAVT